MHSNPHYFILVEIESCHNPIIFGDDVVIEEAINPEIKKTD
jgi:hypothetical protein